MLTNTLITGWRQVTGNDASGTDTYTTQSVVPFRVLSEPRVRKLVKGGKSVMSTLSVHVPGADRGIAEGDFISVGGIEYQVVDSLRVDHPTLGKTVLALAK